MARRRLALGGAGLLLLLSTQGLAQPADTSTRTEARTLGLSGVDAYQAGRYDAASEKLEKAYSLINVPSIGLWSARALAKRGLLVEAANRYFEVASLQVPEGDAAVQRQAQVDAQAELDQLRLQIPRLVIQVTGVEASEIALSIDGQPVPTTALGKPRLVNPGSHRVEARAAATQRSATVELLPGKETPITLDFAAAAPSAASPAASSAPAPAASNDSSAGSTQRTLGFVALGAGAVGLALGGVTGGLALGKRSSLESSGCTDTHCPPEKREEVNQLDTLRLVSSIGFIAGGALAAGGITLLLSAPSSPHRVSAVLAGDGIAVRGRF
ncbi:MAG TPA: hypothetical protein VHB79_27530 [Polyangiaceae bacterium]|nr:hypothetical protein [Polyangiaceae bacterium]